ncbi:hypothetical protein HQQ81_13090 [Microbacteriaceae bacterium VKM Ac-2854]|nr:hypothetical protein [Microbacteriaceae bacterium VKM Ac-2854]
MIIESGHDLLSFLRGVLHECGGERAVVAAYFTMDLRVAGVLRMPDHGEHPGGCPFPIDPDIDGFDDDFGPFRDAIVEHTAGFPFVAVGFHSDPVAVRSGRLPKWRRSLDELVVELAEREVVLLAHVAFGADEDTAWSSVGSDSLRQGAGLECLPITVVEHYPDEDELFLDRLRCDEIAARERLEAAPRRGASFGLSR